MLYRALVAILLSMFGVCHAEVLLTPAKVVKITDRGMILQVGTEPLAAEDDSKTRFWRNRAVCKRDDFKPGENVVVRIKTDEDPPEIREIADEATWKWLEAVRKKPQKGTVTKLDAKYLTLKFEDGTHFSYRITEKTDIRLKGKDASMSDIESGSVVFVDARTLPNYDTWAELVTDEKIPEKATKASSDKGTTTKTKAKPIDGSGTLQGRIVAIHDELRMFDIDQSSRVLHVTFINTTVFTMSGQPSSSKALAVGQIASVTYKRDKAGRIIASRVDLAP